MGVGRSPVCENRNLDGNKRGYQIPKSSINFFFSNLIAFSWPHSAIVALGPLSLHLVAESANTTKLYFRQKDLV